MHQIRRIRPGELPRVRDGETLETRPARPGELPQFGIHPIGPPDLYDVAHADGTPEPEWGVKLIEGPGRYAGLPRSLATQVTPVRFAGEVLT